MLLNEGKHAISSDIFSTEGFQNPPEEVEIGRGRFSITAGHLKRFEETESENLELQNECSPNYQLRDSSMYEETSCQFAIEILQNFLHLDIYARFRSRLP